MRVNTLASDDIGRVIELLAKLPGLGPRSARRAALALIRKPESLLSPLAHALAQARDNTRLCERCGNVGSTSLCGICTDGTRESTRLCVVEDIADLWALERAGVHRGRYHVLGGTLSALEGTGPEDLRIPQLLARVRDEPIDEIILALAATVEGRTTAHYIAEALEDSSDGALAITVPASGVPIGGEFDYMDEGTLSAAFSARRGF